MPRKEFAAHVRRSNGLAVIDLQGEIDALAEESLINQAYAQAARANPAAVLLNFRDVDYINSKGIALIVGILAQARRANLRLAACGLSEHYQEIFQITRIADFMPIFPDEPTAMGGFANMV